MPASETNTYTERYTAASRPTGLASVPAAVWRALAGPFAGWAYYRRSFVFLRPYVGRLLLGFLATLILFGISLVPPLFTQVLLDTIIVAKDTSLLNLLFYGVIAVFFLDLGLGFLNYWLFATMSERLQYDVRGHFLGHIQRLSLSMLDRLRAGGLVYRLMSDTAAIPGAVSGMVVDCALHVLTFFVVAGILLYLHTGMALLCFALIPVHIATLVFFHKPVRRLSAEVRQESESVSGDLIEFFGGMRLVRSLGSEDTEGRRLVKRFDDLRQWGVKSSLLGKCSTLGANTVGNFWSFFVLWYGGHMVIAGAMTAGELIAFLMLLLRLLAPVSGITTLLLGFQDTIVGIMRVYDVLDAKPDVTEAPGAVGLERVEGRVEFDNVTFEYEPGRPVLSEVGFVIEPGERVALVGRSGAGKTTIANLIARFYDPSCGTVRLDGHDLRGLQFKTLRRATALVFQDDFLFSGTIYDNILCGYPGASREQVLRAAGAAHVDEFAERFPHGYDTVVGERGIRLSGGQRQRIALARVLLRDPRVLILDEALSAVDLEAEAHIQDAMEEAASGRTTLIIAHRLSTIRAADRILVLDEGRIVESGRHDELIEHNGFYAKLWERTARL